MSVSCDRVLQLSKPIGNIAIDQFEDEHLFLTLKNCLQLQTLLGAQMFRMALFREI